MIVAAHQPAYLPWLGYLDKLARSDVFIIVDDVQYEAQNFQNRNRVKINNGVAWLTVPLEHGSRDDRICDKRISYQQSPKENWQRRTWATFSTHYRRAAHFSLYADELEEVYTRHWDRLVDLDLHLLTLFMRWLGIGRTVVRSSSMGILSQKSERIVEMVKAVGGDVYLSGKGGSRDYLEVDTLAASGIRVSWQEFSHPVYPQRYPHLGFIPNLGIIDLILNCGPGARAILLGEDKAEDKSARSATG